MKSRSPSVSLAARARATRVGSEGTGRSPGHSTPRSASRSRPLPRGSRGRSTVVMPTILVAGPHLACRLVGFRDRGGQLEPDGRPGVGASLGARTPARGGDDATYRRQPEPKPRNALVEPHGRSEDPLRLLGIE